MRIGPSPWSGAVRCALVVGSLLAAASPVEAQTAWDTPSPRGFTRAPRSGGSVELGFWTASRDLGILGEETRTSVSGLLRVGIVLAELIEVGAIAGWGWGELDFPVIGGDAASASDPLLYAGLVVGEPRFRLRFGAGIALPATPGEDRARTAAFFAAATRGLSEVWLWSPQRVSLAPSATLEAVPVEFLYLEAALRTGVLFPIDDSPGVPAIPGDEPGQVDLVIETSVGAGFRHDNVLAGLRFRAVFSPTVRDDMDRAQTSMELFARGTGGVPDSGLELFGEWRLNMNLDDELGFAFDELKVWGMFFVFGAGA